MARPDIPEKLADLTPEWLTGAQQACGMSWKTIAEEVGLSASGLQRWLQEAPHLRRVKIVPMKMTEEVRLDD